MRARAGHRARGGQFHSIRTSLLGVMAYLEGNLDGAVGEECWAAWARVSDSLFWTSLARTSRTTHILTGGSVGIVALVRSYGKSVGS